MVCIHTSDCVTYPRWWCGFWISNAWPDAHGFERRTCNHRICKVEGFPGLELQTERSCSLSPVDLGEYLITTGEKELVNDGRTNGNTLLHDCHNAIRNWFNLYLVHIASLMLFQVAFCSKGDGAIFTPEGALKIVDIGMETQLQNDKKEHHILCGTEYPRIQTEVLGHSLVCLLVRSHCSLVISLHSQPSS